MHQGLHLMCRASAGSGMASMHALVSFASALNNADADGRVIVDAPGGTLKFLLLNAAAHFAKVGHSPQHVMPGHRGMLCLKTANFVSGCCLQWHSPGCISA